MKQNELQKHLCEEMHVIAVCIDGDWMIYSYVN